MPMYEYECQKCHGRFEFLQKFSDSPKTECPTCQGPLKKAISLSGFSLKGQGWYKDGYASKKSPPLPCGEKTPPCGQPSCPSAGKGTTAPAS
ncbi:MAG: hypothetical protein A3I75_03595 [Deltaproteobacteria bacterium RIFCSPLOWO2_02_FULL_50_16]|nr:MAG: hypothetical protein A2053_01970 [Deltaproteobacteria bacterium GWA2_50_8]OGQ29010.1 MAG: hypothetical protein A3B79_04560 [Deltaproteobacteria bacterium RIFCSPHIGHO2_02_FULL_50_15]OGQ55627.1 MAG: hypothetical protein A3I75_03595 [Deltaproteobacteria bacterium RIFCSPLOWO2_02_FULL_50_16]OGQ68393.1 MAG: hypothetical protein A3F89_07630 [Deltaproteobacteria bacterium RIFCSPLOWO2_12_FULL_50_11]